MIYNPNDIVFVNLNRELLPSRGKLRAVVKATFTTCKGYEAVVVEGLDAPIQGALYILSESQVEKDRHSTYKGCSV